MAMGFRFPSIILLSLLFVLAIPDASASEPDSNSLLLPVVPKSFENEKTISISGPLQDTIKANRTPYMVVSDIEVPLGKIVVIQPGTVFLFKNLSGLHVQGKLIAVGTKQRPIVFSSENDRTANPSTSQYPNPYDWNGIYVHADATGSVFSFCAVNYSVYGIVSETKFFRADPVSFRQNGKSNLVIEGKNVASGDTTVNYTTSITGAQAPGIASLPESDPYQFKRDIVRYSGFSLLLAGIAGGIYSGMQWKKYQDELNSISTNDPNAIRSINETDWVATRNTRDNNRLYTGLGAAVFLLGAAGFYWSFTF